jgi:hypothetical protein
MPREQRFRGHEKRAPSRPGDQPARRSQQDTVGGLHSPGVTAAGAAPRSHGAGRRSQAPCSPTSQSTATRASSPGPTSRTATMPAPAPPMIDRASHATGSGSPKAPARMHDRVFAPHRPRTRRICRSSPRGSYRRARARDCAGRGCRVGRVVAAKRIGAADLVYVGDLARIARLALGRRARSGIQAPGNARHRQRLTPARGSHTKQRSGHGA